MSREKRFYSRVGGRRAHAGSGSGGVFLHTVAPWTAPTKSVSQVATQPAG
jgi:hypothetical protein